MSNKFLEYRLVDGFVNNWLVAGPQVFTIENTQGLPEAAAQVARSFYHPDALISATPVDRETNQINGEDVTWNYFRCHEDHLVDVSALYPGWRYTRAWAFAQLLAKIPAGTQTSFVLTTRGPADVWINQTHVYRREDFSAGMTSVTFEAELGPENTILVCFEQVCDQACDQVMALRVTGLPAEAAEARIHLATNARFPSRQERLEEALESAYLEDWASYQGVNINLRWAEDLTEEVRYNYQVQDFEERIYVEGTWGTEDKEPLDVGHPYRLYERQYYVALRAPAKEFFEQDLRYQRKMPLYVLDNEYTSQPYGDYNQRAQEALEDAAKRDGDLFGVMAQMQLGRWDQLNGAAVLQAVEQVKQPDPAGALPLLGLLGIVYRYSDDPAFPLTQKRPLEDVLLGAAYPVSETQTESQTILAAANAVLAGQRFPDQVFTRSGMVGADLCAKGEKQALAWIQARSSAGFVIWDSNAELDLVLAALAHLTSLAENEDLADRSAVLMDKILVWLAVHSFKGAFAGSHGFTRAAMLKSARLEATSGISRMLWGMGVFNLYTAGTVSLACSQYAFPTFFADIAQDQPAEMLSKTRNLGPSGDSVDVVTWKTPDYMLSSAQDYHPGQAGQAQHIWQATLGPDAVVFANHPGCMSENEAHQPGFWRGNAVLPRTAQWKDVLVSVHNLPEDDWMGFTHAYFPTFAFDEVFFKDGWAFARKDSGYLAITASQGFELVKRGPDGYRELRSRARQNIWLVQMGREALDGSFTNFQEKVLASPLEWQDLAVTYTSLRGETLAFGWSGPLLVNGQKQPLSGTKHVENPYLSADLPAKSMDIHHGEYLLRLNFE